MEEVTFGVTVPSVPAAFSVAKINDYLEGIDPQIIGYKRKVRKVNNYC